MGAEASGTGVILDPKSTGATLHGSRLYSLLRQELTAAKCFDSPWHWTACTMIFVLALVAASYAVLMAAPAWPIRILVCAAIAIAYVLGGYIGHEAGHLSITRRPGLAALLWPGLYDRPDGNNIYLLYGAPPATSPACKYFLARPGHSVRGAERLQTIGRHKKRRWVV